jgi:hypothetical protein
MHDAIATRRIKFKIFPIPKYAKSKKRVSVAEIISPRREFAKISDIVKSKLTKTVMKKRGTTPKVCGSTK